MADEITTNGIITNAADLRDDPAPLYRRYPGQINPQPGRIRIFPGERKAIADYKTELNSMTMAEWLGHIISISNLSPYIRGEIIADLLESERFQTLAKRICDGHSIVWNGIKRIGRLNEDAEDALLELRALVEAISDDPESQANLMSPEEWAEMSTSYIMDGEPMRWRDDFDSVEIEGIGIISKGSSDAALVDMAAKMSDEAKSDDVVFDGDPLDWLMYLRSRCV